MYQQTYKNQQKSTKTLKNLNLIIILSLQTSNDAISYGTETSICQGSINKTKKLWVYIYNVQITTFFERKLKKSNYKIIILQKYSYKF